MSMLPFYGNEGPLATYMNLPTSMDIYFNSEASFLPPGKTFDDLTDDEKALVRSRYRFDSLRPGYYQCITGMKGALD